MFGLTSAEHYVTSVEYLLVYPRIVDLRRMMTLWERPLGASRGHKFVQDDPSRFVGLRDYHPTDPLKRIDWKATARHGKLESRVFEPAATRYMLIALNARTGDAAWQGSNRRLFERAVTVAASVADYARREDYSFGLVSMPSLPIPANGCRSTRIRQPAIGIGSGISGDGRALLGH